MSAVLYIGVDGVVRCLYTELIELGRLGRLQVRRATTIEFDNRRQAWKVRDQGGFVLFSAPTRQACLQWEQQYLNGKQEQMDR